jgi:hypothetical protein
MKVSEIILSFPDNYTRAKAIVAKAKAKSKENNPKSSDYPFGWRADPHQGSTPGAFLIR